MVSKIASEVSSGATVAQAEETQSVLDDDNAETLLHMVKAMGPVITPEEEKHLEQVYS